MKFERMLCAVDFSETSAAALRTAGRLAKALQSELTVLHAQRWEFPLYFTAAQVQELEAQLRQSDQAAVLAVGPGASSTNAGADLREIVCPIDFEGPSSSALDAATFLARKTGARLTVVHVLEGEPESEGAAKATEARLCHWVRLAGTEQCTLRHVVRHGHAAQAIADEAKRVQSDLLLISARPRPSLTSIMFGSTTEALIRTAPCPVLVVPADHGDPEQATAKQSHGKEQR